MKIAMTILTVALAARAAILDRIAVTVGRQVITESDVILDLRVAAFLDNRPVDLSGEQKRKVADRLVDQLLILQEADFGRVPPPGKAEAARLLEQVKSGYGADYRAALARYGIDEDDVIEHLLAGLRAMHYTDLRFRPEVQVSDTDLHDYYNQLIAKSKRNEAAEIPTFEASRDQIEKLLTDQRTSQALDRWLATRRTETQIVYHEQVFR